MNQQILTLAEAEALEITEVEQTQVLVVGSGVAASGAILHALRAGARVGVIEKLDVHGGSASFSAGGFWTFKDYDTFRKLAPKGDAAMQHKLLEDYPKALAFIAENGLDVDPAVRITQHGHGVAHKIDIIGLMAHALDQVRDAGGFVHASTAAKQLIWDGRAVRGVIASRADGTLMRINAEAVVLTSGGFQGSADLRSRYIGINYDKLLVRSNPGSVGDGMRMAQSAGGSLTSSLSGFYGHLIASPIEEFVPAEFKNLTQYHSVSSILLNKHSERFIDETLGDAVNAQALTQEPDAIGVLIFDDHVRRTEGTDEPAPNVGVIDRYAHAEQFGARVAAADTIEDLLDQVATWGLEREKLRTTVDNYLAAVAAGDSFADGVPVSATARAPQEGPFYATEVQVGITFTFGGIRTSLDGEVLDEDGRAVPGLYAGGADAGGISGRGYGGGLGPCFITGSWAGAGAATSVQEPHV